MRRTRIHNEGFALGALLASAALKVATPLATSLTSLIPASAGMMLPGSFCTLLCCGAVLRLLTLPVSVVGDRYVSRMAAALPDMHVAYAAYEHIIQHPRAIHWEKQVALKKFQSDRERIFHIYGTDNIRQYAVHASAAAWTLFLVGGAGTVAASRVLESALQTAAAATSSSTAGSAVTPELLSYFALNSIDPTLTVASLLTLYNVMKHLQRRQGFNSLLDDKLHTVRNVAAVSLIGLGVIAAPLAQSLFVASVSVTPISYFYLGSSVSSASWNLFYSAFGWLQAIAPVWLGAALVSPLQTLLYTAKPLRRLVGHEDLPITHGSYGAIATGRGHSYHVEISGIDTEERQKEWDKAKKTLEFDCDGRIYAMTKWIGLLDEVEDVEFERERNQHRLSAVRKRRELWTAEKQSAKQSDPAASVAKEEVDAVLASSVPRASPVTHEPLVVEGGTGDVVQGREASRELERFYHAAEAQQRLDNEERQRKKREYEEGKGSSTATTR